jgi:hypothetical protein
MLCDGQVVPSDTQVTLVDLALPVNRRELLGRTVVGLDRLLQFDIERVNLVSGDEDSALAILLGSRSLMTS